MKRTIQVNGYGACCYENEELGYLVSTLLDHFNMYNGKYSITIVPGKKYKITGNNNNCYNEYYGIFTKEKEYAGIVCKEAFNKLFFIPDETKRYDIIVKRIK